MDNPAEPTPGSLAEVEELVVRMNRPGAPREIVKIQERIQQLQRSPHGWQIADSLLASQDPGARFYGALSYTVKINSDWDSLSSDGVEMLQQRLIWWLIRLSSQSEAAFVMRKLCSALAASFIRSLPSVEPQTTATRWVRLVICSLCKGQPVSKQLLEQYPDINKLLLSINVFRLVPVLWFCTTLAEDLPTESSNSYQSTRDDLRDASSLIQYVLTSPDTDMETGTQLRKEAFACYAAWISYAQRVWHDTPEVLDHLRALLVPALHCCVNYDMGASMDKITDVLQEYSAFFQAKHLQTVLQMLRTHWDQRKGMLDPEDQRSLSFVRLLLTYGDATLQNLVTDPDADGSQIVMAMMHQLLCLPGYPIRDDDPIIENTVTFWHTLIEFVVDSASTAQPPVWLSSAKSHISQMIQEVWQKVRLPPLEVWRDWRSEERLQFGDFRKDVRDLIQEAHTVLGIDLLQGFANVLFASLQSKDWPHVEASLYCLDALADALGEQEAEDAILLQIFGSSLFQELPSTDPSIPSAARHSPVVIIGNYAQFFERHPEVLPVALNFLFQSLEIPATANHAARAISTLCSSCRSSLTSELDTFILQYERFLDSQTAANLGIEKIIGAIAAIAQALPTDDLKANALVRLLDFIERDVQRSLAFMAGGQVDESLNSGLRALQCLSSTGKSFQAPEDIPVDLEYNYAKANYWNHGPGAAIQERIIRFVSNIIQVMEDLDGEVVEEACQVFRSGYSETTPGPFVFLPQVTVDFVRQFKVGAARIEFVVDTTIAFLSSHTPENSMPVDAEARALLEHIHDQVWELGSPREDPPFAQSCVNFFCRYSPRYLHVLLSLPAEMLERILTWIIECLTAPEPLTKRSAATFWSTFITLQNQPPAMQKPLDDVIQHFGSSLSMALIHGVGGDAARSDLDNLTDPLKKLITRHPRAKAWLEDALLSPQFPGEGVTVEERRRFVQQLATTRGARAANDIVKAFWAKCRGIPL